ncbi:hypothetical protein BB561_000158 [Smittium simulii]|uniref:J domain-containing protein n=1 Tax=Smittium simulii TaxID=133385 RepID=A0A2T9Z0E5_9FUNG|nr:hypothetical protein BB561_000158 [Smittium simulii]
MQYYELCKIHHPDKKLAAQTPNVITKGASDKLLAYLDRKEPGRGSSVERFQDIQQAYEFLVKANYLESKPVDFSNFQHTNRASYYQTRYSNYEWYNSGYGYQMPKDQYSSDYNTEGYAQAPGNSKEELAALSRKNILIAAILSCISAFSMVGFICYIIDRKKQIDKSINTHHLEALDILNKAKLNARKIGFETPPALPKLVSYTKHNNAAEPVTSNNYPKTISNDFNSNNISSSLITTQNQLYSNTHHHDSLDSNNDENLLKTLASLDNNDIDHRICFPYGKSIEYSRNNNLS